MPTQPNRNHPADDSPNPLDEIAAVDLAGNIPRPMPSMAASIAEQMQSSGRRSRSRPRRRSASTGFRKYKYLDWYIESCRTTATIILILFLIVGLSPLIAGIVAKASGDGWQFSLLTLGTLPVAALLGWMIFMGQMAVADFLAVIRDIEENTRPLNAASQSSLDDELNEMAVIGHDDDEDVAAALAEFTAAAPMSSSPVPRSTSVTAPAATPAPRPTSVNPRPSSTAGGTPKGVPQQPHRPGVRAKPLPGFVDRHD